MALPEQAFVSFAREKNQYVSDLGNWVSPYKTEVKLWSDKELRSGGIWRHELKDALEKSNLAVLLLSIESFASTFIPEEEWPAIEQAIRGRGLRLLWVRLDDSPYEVWGLDKYQAAFPPETPLESLSGSDRTAAFRKIADTIREAALAFDAQPAPNPTPVAGPAAPAPAQPTTASAAAEENARTVLQQIIENRRAEANRARILSNILGGLMFLALAGSLLSGFRTGELGVAGLCGLVSCGFAVGSWLSRKQYSEGTERLVKPVALRMSLNNPLAAIRNEALKDYDEYFSQYK